MIYAIIFFLIFILFYLFKETGKVKLHKHVSLLDLKKYFVTLYYKGLNQSGIVIKTPNNEKWIQFIKFLNKKNEICIQFDYPLVECFNDYIEPLKKILEKNKFNYRVENRVDVNPFKVMIVDFNGDIGRMVLLSRLIFEDFYGLKDDEFVEIYYSNVTSKDEIIGNTDVEPSKDDWKKNYVPITNGEYWGYKIGRKIGNFLKLFKFK